MGAKGRDVEGWGDRVSGRERWRVVIGKGWGEEVEARGGEE